MKFNKMIFRVAEHYLRLALTGAKKTVLKFTQREYVAYLKWKLETDEVWRRKAVLAVGDHQTADEKASNSTLDENKIGFSSKDAPKLTPIYRKLKNGMSLSFKENNVIAEKIEKYAGQILKTVCDIDKLKYHMEKDAELRDEWILEPERIRERKKRIRLYYSDREAYHKEYGNAFPYDRVVDLPSKEKKLIQPELPMK